MRKHGGTPSWQDKHVTPAAMSPPGVARGRFVGGQQSGLAGCKPPPPFTRGASSCSSQGRCARGNHGAPLHNRVHLPTYLLGACNAYRRHVPSFTYPCRLRTELTKKDQSRHWGEEEAKQFQELKDTFGNIGKLGTPNSE